MRPSRRVLLMLSFVSATLLAPASWAQFPQAGDTTSTPTPGGHDYLHSPVETMNPANGSVSIRIPLPVPSGRQLTMPLSIAYDSTGAFYYGSSQGNYAPHWATPPNVPFSKGGWSYTFPLMSYTQETWTETNGFKNFTCKEGVNYVFQDPAGNRHNLALTPVINPIISYTCSTSPGIQQAGEGPISATTPGGGLGVCCRAVTVTDGNGTVYSFSQPGTTLFQWLPSSVTDRNGNSISISVSGSPISSATVTDTVGRTAISVGTFGASPDNINIAGLSIPYKAYWTTASASFTISVTNSGTWACPTALSGSAGAVSQVILPNGQSYTLTYDPTYGMLSKIIYPTGGYVRYVWGLNSRAEALQYTVYATDGTPTGTYDCHYDFPAIADRYVSFDGTTEVLHQHLSYSTSWAAGDQYTTKTTTVTTYDLVRNTNFNTVYTYTGVSAPCVLDLNPNSNSGCVGDFTQQIPVEQTVQYYGTNGSLLRTIAKSWYNNNLRILGSEQTTLDNGQSSLTVSCYNTNELETERDEYDFGTSTPTLPTCASGVPTGTVSGPLLRKTVTTYATSTNMTAYHVIDKPASIVVYGGSNNKVAETDYTYDSPAGTVTSGIVQHITSCNCGNLTTQSQWLNSSGSSLTTNFTNDDTGQRLTMTDPRLNPTSYSYADSYSSGTPPGPTNAYLTQITHPNTGVAHLEHFAYAYASGEVTSSTGQNSFVTTYKYVDNLARLTEIDYPTPDGGVTTKTYVDTPNAVSVETKQKIDGSRWTDAFVLYNGLGQPSAQSTANGEATPWDRIDTCYDGTGRVRFSSYPYQVATATTAPNCSTGVGDTIAYDALGRTTQVSHADGNTILSSYTGRATQVQDEGNGTRRVSRVSQIDGLGRLASVCEVTSATQLGSSGTPAACGQDISATGFLTTYGYDTLSNLLSVSQNGLNQRLFSYDFLSRLTSASNPESGSNTYTYDSDTNCSAPDFAGLLVSKLDARGIRTCMQYDALNRLTQKNYSDGTPTASFNFDQTSAYGVTLTNTTGRLSSQNTASPNPTGAVFSYDQLGRLKINSQCTPQNCSTPAVFAVTYTYDLLGDMLTSTNGAGVTLTYAVNTAPRLTTLTSSLSDSNHPGTLFSAAHYNPAGSLLSATLGGSVGETRTYDARLRLASITDGTNYTLTIPSSGGYAPNSDILAANDSVNGNWTYTYDDFNRLMGSNKNSGGEVYSYDYDRLGNRWHQNGTHTMMLSFSGSNNRMDGYSYDAAGNLLSDGTHSYAYDAENRISKVDNGSTASYVYDANGQRVRKTTSSGSVDYLYDLASHEITELSSSGSWNRGEVYAGGRHLATYGNSTTYLIHADQLGTERVRTNSSGASCETITSLPFGDWQTTSGTCSDASPMHFTGKERDSESGLDNFGARYNASSMGRFMSPDPSMDSARLRNPQSWNRYAYTINNPLRYIDPDGELWVATGDGNNPYSWVDECGKKQTCYESIGAVVGDSLRLYGSNNAQDITNIQANQYGMVDLNRINQQHDAAFDVDTRTDYSYVSLQTGADFFNFVQDYQSNYSDAPNLYVTEAGAEDGSLVPGHLTHRDGKQIDLRYVDDNGRPIQNAEAYNLADADRMWDIFRMSHNAGMTQIYAGDESEWGDFARRPPPPADPHETHFHLSIPNPRPPRN